MQPSAKPPGSRDAAAVLLGYLNFSSGAFDAAAWRAMNDLFADAEPASVDGAVAESTTAAERVADALGRRLGELETTEAAFRDATQARWAVEATFRDVLPAYRRFHADLLENQPPGAIERPFFVMAAIRGLLAEAAPDDDRPDAIARVIDRLNDYVGWRPFSSTASGRQPT